MRRSADTRCAALQHGTQMLESMYAMTTVQILRWSQSLSGPIHVTAPVIAVKFRRKSRKFFLYLDSYGETRPSSSKYGRKKQRADANSSWKSIPVASLRARAASRFVEAASVAAARDR